MPGPTAGEEGDNCGVHRFSLFYLAADLDGFAQEIIAHVLGATLVPAYTKTVTLG
jgi:hypothetical protein